MEDEFRKDFEELLRLMDAGKLQDFKKKAKNEIEKKDEISGGIQHLVKKRNIKIFETISSIEEKINDYLIGNFNYSIVLDNESGYTVGEKNG